MPLIVLADTSGSMAGNKIASLNQALKELVQDLCNDEQSASTVMFSLFTFDATVKQVHSLQAVNSVKLSDLSANGQTSMGQVFRAALAELSDPKRVPERSLVPTIVLATDGQPTDAWERPLDDLINHRRAGKAIRLALAIGEDADMNVLKRFVTPEFPVLKADQPDKIRTFFRYVSWVSKSQSKSQGQAAKGARATANLQPPPDLLP